MTERWMAMHDMPDKSPGFGFDRYAEVLSSLLTNATSSLAIGVFGGYGYGKTTLLRKIHSTLPAASYDGNELLNVWFNPWRYDHEEHLLPPFVAALLRNPTLKKENTVCDNLVTGLRSFLAGIKLKLPFAELSSEAALKRNTELAAEKKTDVARIVGRYDDFAGHLKNVTSEPAPKDGEKQVLKRRIVVFIDDLDRCVPHRAFELLEAIKSFMDIPGFLFVIALDPRAVMTYVRRKYGPDFYVEPKEYLEKMIQVPFHLPRPTLGDEESVKLGMLVDSLLRGLAKQGNTWAEEMLKPSECLCKLDGFLPRNVRQVKRLLNSHQVLYATAQNVMDGFDAELMLILLILQTRWPRAYWVLCKHTTEFRKILDECHSNGGYGPTVKLKNRPKVVREMVDDDLNKLVTGTSLNSDLGNSTKLRDHLNLMAWPIDTEAETVAVEGRNND